MQVNIFRRKTWNVALVCHVPGLFCCKKAALRHRIPLASLIISAIGGPENVRSLTHCATRLRFELADASKVDQNALEHMKGVLGAVPQSGDRFQVVIGGGVATVYENIMHLPEMANAGAASASGEGQKSNADDTAEARSKARGKVAWLDSFFEYLADSFRPILGVLLGASIIIALINLCISIGIVPGEEANTSLVFIKAIWKGVFYFLPIMVAYNASKKLKVDPWLGGAIMAILMTPQFTSLMDAKTTTCVENAALGTKACTANIFGIPMALSDYSGNVFVPLLMAAVLALVYHGLKKIIPDSVQIVFVPFFSMIIVGALTAVGAHSTAVPAALAAIVKGAFGLRAAGGGIVGYGLSRAVTWGFKRGAFSNEAGLGSSVMVHAASNVKEPVQQGMWGIFEVFTDTMVVCTLTALVVLTSGFVDLDTGRIAAGAAGSALVGQAFDAGFGTLGSKLIAVCILLFAYSTTLGWSCYGCKAVEYLFGAGAGTFYRVLFVALMPLGAVIRLDLAWTLSATFNGQLMLPRLIGGVALSGTVVKLTQNYLARKLPGSAAPPLLSAGETI